MTEAKLPEWEPVAIWSDLDGFVVVDVHVASDGSVRDVDVVEHAHPLLGRAAERAARASGFAPATRRGTPVAGSVRVTYEFVNEVANWGLDGLDGCSGDDHEPSVRGLPAGPPDVADPERSAWMDMGGVEDAGEVFWHDGVLFIGDIPVGGHAALVDFLGDDPEAGESLATVKACRLRVDIDGQRRDCRTVWVARTLPAGEPADEGRVLHMQRVGDEYVIEPMGRWGI